MDLDDIIDGFQNIKISAFTKYASFNKNDFKDITIGPNKTVEDENVELSRYTYYGGGSPKTEDENLSARQLARPLRKSDKDNRSGLRKYYVTKEDDGLPIREIIKDIENERHAHVQNAVRSHFDEFQRHSELLENESKQRFLAQQQLLVRNMQEEEHNIVRLLNEDDAVRNSERQKLMYYFQNLAEQRKKNAAELEAKEKRQKELSLIVENINKIHVEFSSAYLEVLNVLKSYQENVDLKTLLHEEIQQLKPLFTAVEEIVTKCKNFKVDTSHVTKMNEILNKTKSLKEQVATKVKIKQSEIKAKAELLSLPASSESTQVAVTLSSTDTVSNQAVKINKETTSKLDKYISRENMKTYTEIIEKLDQSVQDLPDDHNLKQFKFDCKKAVNIPVNAISAVSAYHLKDKYDRLVNLLLGKVVCTGENQQFSASKHPKGVAFCINLLAKKMVLQGDLMISSNPDAAFAYATIIVSLWNTVPDFGLLLLGYFYKLCPYLVPFNIPKSVGQSDEEFYKSHGYQYKEGQIEKQDKYLKRMTGFMRLYGAILITKPKSDQKGHPHGIEQGWRWLASIMKLEPRIDITATMLHTFLEVAGYSMQLRYGKAFQKLLKIIIVKFIPFMKRNDSGGPVTRLEVLLQDYQQKGQFDKPEGMLPDNFW